MTIKSPCKGCRYEIRCRNHKDWRTCEQYRAYIGARLAEVRRMLMTEGTGGAIPSAPDAVKAKARARLAALGGGNGAIN